MTGTSDAAADSDDPFAVLGLDRNATLDQVRAARRRLAFDLHPDRGGDLAAMQRINVSFERCVAHVTGRRPLVEPAAGRSTVRPEHSSAGTDGGGSPAGRRSGERHRSTADAWRSPRRRVEHDTPSFTVDALPAETFEALLVALSWIGELLDDDPPYVLECHLVEPAPCWCRLDIVPDAGGSTVSLTVVSPADAPSVSAEVVRDVWVEQLNQLGRPMP